MSHIVICAEERRGETLPLLTVVAVEVVQVVLVLLLVAVVVVGVVAVVVVTDNSLPIPSGCHTER